MARRHHLSVMALILLMVWGCGKCRSLQSQVVNATGQPVAKVKPKGIRFTKAQNSVITDSVTGLEWFVGPDQNNTWYQARAWAKTLTVAGGGWLMPSPSELKALYQKEAGTYNNMDPVFRTTGVWIWSGQLKDSSFAWGFTFSSGHENWHGLDYSYGRQPLAVRSRYRTRMEATSQIGEESDGKTSQSTGSHGF